MHYMTQQHAKLQATWYRKLHTFFGSISKALDNLPRMVFLLEHVYARRHQLPAPDEVYVDHEIGRLAKAVQDRVAPQSGQGTLCRALCSVMMEEGFVGNTHDYYNPENSMVRAFI